MSLAVLNQDMVDQIKAYLRWYPKGQTITNIAKKLKMNRNLVAKNLDLLLISGQVEAELAGTAKVYTLSQRVPISAMLEFSSDYVLMLDAEHRVIQLNEPLLTFLKEEHNTLVGKAVTEIDHPFFRSLPVRRPENTGETSREKVTEVSVVLSEGSFCFRVKQVPTVFEDGKQGITCIIENITGKKEAEARISRYIENLEFLTRTSARFADMEDDEDIYQYIVDSIAEIEPKAHVVIMAINPDTKMTCMKAYAGDKETTRILLEYFGNFLQGEISMDKVPEVWQFLASGALVKCEGEMKSLYIQTYRMFPEHLCNELQERMKENAIYSMGCTCRMGVYGNLALRFRHNYDMTNRETVEAFVRQAGVALQRRYLREKLRKAEEQIRVLERSSARPGIPVAQIVNGVRTGTPDSSGDTDIP
jgi:PAS domain-containing protein